MESNALVGLAGGRAAWEELGVGRPSKACGGMDPWLLSFGAARNKALPRRFDDFVRGGARGEAYIARDPLVRRGVSALAVPPGWASGGLLEIEDFWPWKACCD